MMVMLHVIVIDCHALFEFGDATGRQRDVTQMEDRIGEDAKTKIPKKYYLVEYYGSEHMRIKVHENQ